LTSPLRAPTGRCASTLRKALAEAGYTDDAVAQPERLARYLPTTEQIDVDGDGRLAAIVSLLALGRTLPRAALDGAPVRELAATGLITVENDHVRANYRLVPHQGLLLAGHLRGHGGRDVVMPFTVPSVTHARLTPRTRFGSMLDLGTGSGVLALLGARHCDRVTAVDINQRALDFARFNAGLNGIEQVAWLRGSWFDPVGEERFDLITANPPYVVSPENEFTYRDSGLGPGELVAALCRDSAARLQDGGLAIVLCSWANTAAEDWSVTPISWVADLGCDTLVVGYETTDPLEYAVRWNTPPVNYLGPAELRETVSRWLSYANAHGIASVSFGPVVLRRTERTPWMAALRGEQAPGDHAAEQLMRLLDGRDFNGDLLDATFSLPDGVSVQQRFQRRSARFVARPAMVKLDGGLGVEAAIDPDALDVVFACDGRRPLKEISGAGASLAAIRELLSHGLLELV
jgi:methylase of polypeptide subunit release factors